MFERIQTRRELETNRELSAVSCRREAAADDRQPAQLVLSRRRKRGSAVVEFALVFIPFLLLVFGLMELSRALWVHHTLVHAARQAARYAIVHGSLSEVPATSAKIEEVLGNNALGLDPQDLQVTTTWTPNNNPGDQVEVEVQYNLQLVASPLILSQDVIPLSSTSRMVILN